MFEANAIGLDIVDKSSDYQSTLANTFEAPVSQVNLKKIALSCINKLLFDGQEIIAKSYEQQFLKTFSFSLDNTNHWEKQLQNYLSVPVDEDIRLLRLAKQLGLSHVELLVIVLVLAVEEDPMVGRAIAYIQAPVGGSRPTLSLLESAFASQETSYWIAAHIVSGVAVRSGVLSMINEDSPIPERIIKIPTILAFALQQAKPDKGRFPLPHNDTPMVLPDSIIKAAKQHASSLEDSDCSVLIIRSACLKEAGAVAAMVSQQLGKTLKFYQANSVELNFLGPLCLINQSLPVLQYDLAPGEQKRLPELIGYYGPRIIIMGLDGNIDVNTGTILSWTIPLPSREERQKLWKQYLKDDDLAKYLAENHVQSAGHIMALSKLAIREAKLKQRIIPNTEDLRQAAWSVEVASLTTLAQPMIAQISDETLVLAKQVKEKLQHLLQRCRYREVLVQHLGATFQAHYHMGVRALFAGPPGTGKTLVASWLATQLDLPLYRVDLASIVSSNMSKTEKNISTLLAKAEQAEIVLLFDDADYLFENRMKIEDTNDCQASSQKNYLLQRIEFYQGIVLMTSNSRRWFDSEFTRRLDKIIEFPLPEQEDRRSLWLIHLGANHQLSLEHLNQLAILCGLAGGHIRNAVLAAAVIAQAGHRLIQFDDIITGLVSEYHKLGRQIPIELKRDQSLVV